MNAIYRGFFVDLSGSTVKRGHIAHSQYTKAYAGNTKSDKFYFIYTVYSTIC
jgi:hypothetical protein